MASAATVRLCTDLWQRAGGGERFPRDIEALCAWTLPLGVVSLPVLWTADVARRLAAYGVAAGAGRQRRLHACLIARDGQGLVLIDGSDPPDERRFSLAHEAAHFLLECHLPRERLAARLGADALAAFDGRRAATLQERVDALLGDVALQPRLHLMERDGDGFACGTVAGAECEADELAVELLAPEAAVLARFDVLHSGSPAGDRREALRALLTQEFGLPAAIAGAYARRLFWRMDPPDVTEWLGLSLLPSATEDVPSSPALLPRREGSRLPKREGSLKGGGHDHR